MFEHLPGGPRRQVPITGFAGRAAIDSEREQRLRPCIRSGRRPHLLRDVLQGRCDPCRADRCAGKTPLQLLQRVGHETGAERRRRRISRSAALASSVAR